MGGITKPCAAPNWRGGSNIASAGSTGSVNRALDVLMHVANSGNAVTLAEVAAETRLAKPTAHRILNVLAVRGLLRRDTNRAYHLGPACFALAGKVLSQMQFTREARPTLQWLQTLTPETIHFAVMIGSDLVYVDKAEGRRSYRMGSRVGMTPPIHCTAIGKCALAYMKPERRATYLVPDRLVRRTPKTITDVAVLEAELERIYSCGFAIDDGENEDDTRCVAAPVFDARNEVIGGISVSAPIFSMNLDSARSLAPAVITAAERISAALGASADSEGGRPHTAGRPRSADARWQAPARQA